MKNKESILVIDDSPTVRRLAELVLSKEGYDVYTAEDGDEGLQAAREKEPSVIIVDFIMPRMNGYDFCKNVRSDEHLSNIPIVLITSKGKDVGQGFDTKFNIARYLQKPFEAETLLSTVRETLDSGKEEAGTLTETVAEQVETVAEQAETVAEQAETVAEQAETVAEQAETVAEQAETVDEQAVAETPEENQMQPQESATPEVPEHVAAEAQEGDQTPSQEGTTPSYSSPEEMAPASAAYASFKENIEKEFRHYFGQELTVLLKNTMIQSLKETDLVRSSRRILSGEIAYISIDDVMKFITMSGVSGKLSVLTNSFNSEIYLESGQVVFASISRPDYRTCLEEFVMQDGNPRRNEILAALSEARGNNLSAGALLLDRGLITEDDLTACYRRLSEDALHQTLSAASGHFYIEDVPLPREIERMKLRISLNEIRR